MSRVNALVIRTAGSNCDQETVRALTEAGANKVQLVHINEVKKNKNIILQNDFIVIPGGFSYGDYINAGKILSNEIMFILKEEIDKFLKNGKFLMGICNGFQVLVKSGILSGAKGQTYTLMENDSKHFESRWIYLKTNPGLFWTKDLPKVITLPIAHGEGKFMVKKDHYLKELLKNNQIAVSYSDPAGNLNPDYPINPNGSLANIAGIVDKNRQIFGLMPHPERFTMIQHHPYWNMLKANHREIIPVGIQIFKNAIQELEHN